MLSALLVIWIAVIPLAILGAAWANARCGSPRATRTESEGAGAARQWARLRAFVGHSAKTLPVQAAVAMDEGIRAILPTPVAVPEASQRAPRPAGATLLVATPRTQLRRECAAGQLRGRGGAGRTELS
ncbi:MAG: hypothetical protein WBQ18_10695 [Solirubrobacteraceae bacterium]